MATLQASQEVGGYHTQILVQPFADRILVLVTQLGKVGTLIQASIPESAPLSIPAPDAQLPNQHPLLAPSPAIQLTPLFGSAPSEHMHTLHSLYVSQIATMIWTQNASNTSESSRRSVIVGLSLRRLDGIGEELAEREKLTFLETMSILQGLISRP